MRRSFSTKAPEGQAALAAQQVAQFPWAYGWHNNQNSPSTGLQQVCQRLKHLRQVRRAVQPTEVGKDQVKRARVKLLQLMEVQLHSR